MMRMCAHASQVQQLAARVDGAASSAAPSEAPPLIVDEPEPDAEADADESGEDSEPELETCSAGARLPADLVTVGRRVAVPFRIDAVEAFCPGDISSVTASRVTVKFSDGTWQVARERLFAIAE